VRFRSGAGRSRTPSTLNELLEVAARENRELLAVRERLEEAKARCGRRACARLRR
jgi:hypothetical protein